MEMPHLVYKFRELKFELSEDLLVHLVLIFLLTRFNQFKVSYNYQKENLFLNELKKDKHKVLPSPLPLRARTRIRKRTRIKKLQMQYLKRTNKRNQVI